MNFNYEDLLDGMHDGIYFVDRDRKVIYWNHAAEKITGFSASEVIGRRCSDNILIHVDARGENLCQGRCLLAETIADGVFREAEVFCNHKQGHRVPVWMRVGPLRDGNGTIVGAVQMFADISSREYTVLKVAELEKLAFLDDLTQLASRRYVELELEGRFAEMKRYFLSFGILFIDIDHFKNVNDTYGHDVGDLVLKTIANTLKDTMRPYDLFGRWGGEEFLGVIRNVDGPGLVGVGNRVRALVEKTRVHTPGTVISVTISIGATLASASDSLTSLVKRADTMLYAAKARGRNCLTID